MLKFKKTILAAAALCMAATVSAQTEAGNGYNRVNLSYDNVHFSANSKLNNLTKGYFLGNDGMSLNGFGLEYTRGIAVSKKLPMFVEAGIKMEFAAGTVSDYDKDAECEYKLNAQSLSFIIPINYVYSISIGNNMSVAPYLGINFKLNTLGRQKSKRLYDDPDEQDRWDDQVDDVEYGEKGIEDWKDIFSKKDVGRDGTWNRFQMGWQIGCGLNIDKLHIALQYGTDFIAAMKHDRYAVNSGTFALKLGYNF